MTRFGEISPIWQLERVYLVFCKIITYFGKFLGLISTGPLIKKNFTIAGSNEFTVSKERERERNKELSITATVTQNSNLLVVIIIIFSHGYCT